MAIISCPACKKRISSAAKSCKFCKIKFEDSKEDEKVLREISNKRFAKRQRMQNASFLSVLLFAAGAIVMYFGITQSETQLATLGRGMLSVGFAGYVVARVMTFMMKKS